MSKRTQRCVIRLSENEYTQLHQKAQASGLTLSAFIRHAIHRCEIRACPPPDYRKFIWELRRIGANIDQILRIAYTKAPLQVPDLKKALSSLVELEGRISEAYLGDNT